MTSRARRARRGAVRPRTAQQHLRAPQHAPVATELARVDGIRLLDVRCAARHSDPPYDEEHATECISLVTRGVFTYRTGFRPAVLGPGWLMLGNAGEPYVCSHEHGQDRGDDCLVLHFSQRTSELIRSAVGEACGPRAFVAASLPPVPRVCALMQLLEDSARHSGPDLDLSEASFAVASCILRELTGSSRRPGARMPSRRAEHDRVHEAVQYIENEATESLSLGAIAAAVDLSPFHFLRLFRRKAYGQPAEQ